MKITGVILAAGTSSRMGSENKLTLVYNGHTMIEEVLMQMSDSNIDDILIVTGYEHTRIEGLLAGYRTDGIDFAYNRDFHLGRASSIKCAVERIGNYSDAALFMVADKPQITTSLINRAIDLFMEERPSLLYVETPEGRGHPIIFSKKLFHELMLLEGDRVGDDVVSRCKNETVRLQDASSQLDIDTMDDYRALMKHVLRE